MNNNLEFVLVAYDAVIGQELATAIEVRKSDILAGIASRATRRQAAVPGHAQASRYSSGV